MDLSALGIKQQYRVIAVTDRNITKDFMRGKIQVIGVECNTRGVYGSPLQKVLAGRHPAMLPSVTGFCTEKLGTTDLWRIDGKRTALRQFVANMYLSRGYGLGRSGPNRSSQPVNRFSPRNLQNAFDSLVEQCIKNNVPLDKTIGIQRVYGGLGGVPWAEVLPVLDALCEKHKMNIFAYLPSNYDTSYVRGQQ